MRGTLLTITYAGATQKEGPHEAGLRTIHWPKQSGSCSLVVNLGEVVLRGLRTVGNELAEIFGGRLGPRDEHFTARTGEIGLDLHRLVDALGRTQFGDAREEGFRVLIDRLLDIAPDLGGLGHGVGNRGLDRSRHLLGAGISIRSAL